MKLEKRVTSLKLSKKLAEFGVEQEESVWFWCRKKGTKDKFQLALSPNYSFLNDGGIEIIPYKGYEWYAALTVAELGEINYFWMLSKINEKYSIMFPVKKKHMAILDKNPANVLAKMIIHLIKNKLIKGKDIKCL